MNNETEMRENKDTLEIPSSAWLEKSACSRFPPTENTQRRDSRSGRAQRKNSRDRAMMRVPPQIHHNMLLSSTGLLERTSNELQGSKRHRVPGSKVFS